MDTKKLDKWADLLLDTGKRNHLINFKDTRASTVEVLLPSSDELFEKMSRTVTFEVFDPKIVEVDDCSEVDSDKVLKASDTKYSFLARYSSQLKRRNQILLYNMETNPITAVKNIYKKAKEFIEETGVNVAYMAFGFINWKESDSSSCVFHAPVLLVPIHLEQVSSIDSYCIKSTEDDVIVNPTFSYKINAEYGVKLPDYNDETLSDYLAKVKQLVAKLQWTVSTDCKIGIFSFLKINMYRDLKDHSAAILANPNVRLLLGEPIDSCILDGDDGATSIVSDPLIELHSVVDADSSQIEAIEMAKSGKSFVLQGPPGTGKSQTITNIIAECLSDGKKVLFVSEKLAALNVVYDKLKQVGLSEFCLALHSHKANKKDVIADIYRTLCTGKSEVTSKSDCEIESKEKAMKQLDAYVIELHKQRPIIEKSLYQMYEAYAALRSAPDIKWIVPQLTSKGETYLAETSFLLKQYVNYIPTIGYDYRKNSWYGYTNKNLSYYEKSEIKTNLEAAVILLQALSPLLQELSEKYEIACSSIQDAHIWQNFFRFASTSRLITPLLLQREHFDAVNFTLKKLQSQSVDILSLRTVLDDVFDKDVYKVDGAAYHKKLIKLFSGTFSRLFNSEYKQLIRDLHLCKKDSKKPSYREAVIMTERLAHYQQKCSEYNETEAPIKEFLGPAYAGVETNWSYITKQMDVLQTLLSENASFGNLTSCSDFISESKVFADYANRLEAAFAACSEDVLNQISRCFDPSILNLNTACCSSLLARFQNCINEIDRLDNWCHFKILLSELTDKQIISYVETAINQNLEPTYIVDAFQKLFYYQWIMFITSNTGVLSSFSRNSQDELIKIFKQKDKKQFEINRFKICAELSARRPSFDTTVPAGSALSVLRREGEKKRKQKSIRALLAETGELVLRIKPCFLMSPLSVSTYLPADSVHFDVVIFDEASQIFPQDAIGAIYRAKQMIVVGDSKQMPPSNFFSTIIEVEDHDEETGDVTDFESILDLCSTSLQQLRLRWHYRSRHEKLITFSNKNFYGNDLITFPAPTADASGLGVDYYYVDGIFDRKTHTNRKEAEFIVDLIYENIDKYPDRSLGVVAFSVAQQDLIDKLLSKRRQSTPEKEIFFKSNEKEPFFIKNLETVQGDERDTIIFSVAYGVDAQGRLLHNFGPLNRVGGERRLNVATTRAKYNVQLVSSMHYADIDLKRTSAEGAKLLREYLDFAENGDIALERTPSTNPFDQFDSDFELEVCDFLRSNGFSVDTQVGCSGFKIDLGLKRPNSSDYVLAIECDGATYHSSKNARDRDRLRQEILEGMGWRFYRIWSTDWFRNKAAEQQLLLEKATDAVKHPAKTEMKPIGN